MKISALDLFWYKLPTRVGLRLRNEVVNERRGFVLRARAGDLTGWGEAAPLPGFSGENMDHVYEFVSELRPRLLGEELGEAPEWMRTCDSYFAGGVPSGRFGVETALVSIWSQMQGVSLRKFLKPDAGSEFALNALMSVADAESEESVARIRDGGFTAVKIKVGRGAPADEAQQVIALAGKLGANVRIRLDANRAWRLADAVAFAKGLGGLELDYIEEPVQRCADLPLFIAQTGLPVALDETISDTPRSVWEQYEGLRALVVKPTIAGGLARSARLAQLAQSRGWRVVISSAFESGLGTRVLCEMAAAYSGPDTPAGLDTYRLLDADVLRVRPALGARQSIDAWPAAEIDESALNLVT